MEGPPLRAQSDKARSPYARDGYLRGMHIFLGNLFGCGRGGLLRLVPRGQRARNLITHAGTAPNRRATDLFPASRR
jgi:hypothetical protein